MGFGQIVVPIHILNPDDGCTINAQQDEKNHLVMIDVGGGASVCVCVYIYIREVFFHGPGQPDKWQGLYSTLAALDIQNSSKL